MHGLRYSNAAGLLLALAGSALSSDISQCDSYGIDFQSGGQYFQNSLSNDPFSLLQEFEGCQVDVAHNVLVDPNGDQSECSESPLTPDNTPQLVNCTSWPKSSLYDGDWTLLIISNNGNGDPIAYQREFGLSVGPQQTYTYTPTVTYTDVSTPVVTSTSTSTNYATITKVNQVTLKASTTTRTTTRALVTLTVTKRSLSVASTVNTVPASCVIPKSTRAADPICSIKPTILGELDGVVESIIGGVGGVVDGVACGLLGCKRTAAPAPTAAPELSGSAKFKRAIIEGRTPSDSVKRAYVADRAARLRAVEKRAPDATVVTSTATTGIVTSTVSSTAPTYTAIMVNDVTITSTAQVYQTTTLPPVTQVKTKWIALSLSTKTSTIRTTITNTVTTTSAGAVASCASRGGQIR